MNKIEKLTLIEGNFSEEEAKEILMSIFSNKIQFHETKNFSSLERYGIQDEIASNRIPALKKELEKMKEILNMAKNKKLMINSEIHISLSKD